MNTRQDPPVSFATAIEQLHDVVAAELGHSEFGPQDYLPGLTVLLESMDYDPHFSTQGRRLAWAQVIDVLRGRAQAVKSMQDNPGWAHSDITAPIVITGIPRSGTTALHRLLAVDERFQGLQSWLLHAPMPRPPRDAWESHPEFQRTVAALAQRYELAPGKRAAHHMAAEEVHECCMLLRQSFVSNLWSCGWSAASYDAWWQCQSERPAYAFYRDCVKLIGMHEPEKRWLLKNPGHIENLDLLFAVFPDARVIQTHRDPAKAIPSLVSLLIKSHPAFEMGRVEQRARILLRREAAKWANAIHKADIVRQRYPDQIMDVVHKAFHQDPMGVVDRIYQFIDLPLPDSTRAEMTARVAAKPEMAHGAHRYSLADHGMTPEQIRQPFEKYVERFDMREPAL